jgi:trimethylamine:corrinoid methyltransferase-like protein
VLYTKLAERRAWDEWDQAGRVGMGERAQAEAERLLAEHEVPPLTVDQERELDAIVGEAERALSSS